MLTIPDTVAQLRDEGALFVINHSGGKDSQAMMIELLRIIPRQQMVVMHACLGEVEWEGAMELARDQAADAGIPFVVAKATKTLLQMVEHRFATRPDAPSWPSATHRACTSDMKRGPIEREIRRYAKLHGYTRIATCLGIRAAESPGRAKRSALSRSARNSVAGRDWYEWNPIHSMSTPDVFATIAAAGQQPHWAYAAGNDRLSCVFCILGSPKDLANGARHRPELYAKYLEMEQRTGYTMHQSRKPLEELVRLGEEQTRARSVPRPDRQLELALVA